MALNDPGSLTRASEFLIGIAKALVGYFGAWASVQFDLEQFPGRLALTAALVLFHSLALTGLLHVLVASPPPFSRSILPASSSSTPHWPWFASRSSTAPGVSLILFTTSAQAEAARFRQGRENATRASLSGAFSILA